MKNLHVIPTDNYSTLVLSTNKYGGLFKSEHYSPMRDMGDSYQNIYITNDEEIKEGDYKYHHVTGVRKALVNGNYTNQFKIILTTDQDLIKDNVQSIDDVFLDWFVKNPTCECVEVKTYFKKIGVETDANGYREMDVLGKDYKIIIPKEESKQKTIEDVAQIFKNDRVAHGYNITYEDGFIDAANYQSEKMYSEEELKEFCIKYHNQMGLHGNVKTQEWFEQNKKK
jgi:hypothetical protein